MATRSSSQQQAAHPDWRHLPAPALLCVCHHLPDLAAFFAFAGTCTEWRDVANFGKKAFMASQPPLLCTAHGKRFYSPINAKCYKNRRVAAAIRRLRGTIRDVSQGYLVIEAHWRHCPPSEKKLVLLNPFTHHRVGGLPRLSADLVHWVVLTAPPTSPDCVVVARSSWRLPRWSPHDSEDLVAYVRPGDARWTHFERIKTLITIKPVASADGKVYVWANNGGKYNYQLELVVMEFFHGEEPKLTRLWTIASTDEQYPYRILCLAEPKSTGGGDDELLLVRDTYPLTNGLYADLKNITFEIYRLDASEQQVVQKSDGLGGGRALVMNDYSCRVASNPAGWGGRGDDVYYYVGYGSEAWRFRLRDATTAASHCYALWPKTYHNLFWLLPVDTCS